MGKASIPPPPFCSISELLLSELLLSELLLSTSILVNLVSSFTSLIFLVKNTTF